MIDSSDSSRSNRVHKVTFVLVLCLCFAGMLLGHSYLRELKTKVISISKDNTNQNALPEPTANNTTCELEEYNKTGFYSGEQSDPCLIQIVRENVLVPPSPHPSPVTIKNFTKQVHFGASKKLELIKAHIMDHKKPGFFIEAGANDGEWLSTTLALEVTHNWAGLLIEANPASKAIIQKTRQRSWLANVALCTTPFAGKIDFYAGEAPGFVDPGASILPRPNKSKSVQCIPLYTLIAALNVSTVDFFSLDVEGVELGILKTIPFDRVIFKMITVEHVHIPEGQAELKRFMKLKGYHFISEIHGQYTADSLFIHTSVHHKFT